MNDILRILFVEQWWSWTRGAHEPYLWTDIACRAFNFIEATAWFTFGFMVLYRRHRRRGSRLELWYALAFFLFGISDVIEARVLTSWLLWWKGFNLVALFLLRRKVMRRLYPDARVF